MACRGSGVRVPSAPPGVHEVSRRARGLVGISGVVGAPGAAGIGCVISGRWHADGAAGIFTPAEVAPVRASPSPPRHRPRSACGPDASPSEPHTTRKARHDRHRVSATYGVHSEVGRLRKVLVCAPGPGPPAAHADQHRRAALRRRHVGRERPARPRRLRQQADPARRRGRRAARPARRDVGSPGARDWLLDRKIVPNDVGTRPRGGTRAYLESLPPTQLAEFLIGGLATRDLPEDFRRATSPGPRVAPAPASTSCRRCRTRSTRATPPAGSTAASP